MSSGASPHPNPEVRIVERPGLGEWAPSWDVLVAAAPVPSPFQRSWWLGAVAPPRSVFVLVVDGDQLIGGLALQLRRTLGVDVFTVCGAGALCPDHLDILAAEGRRPEVVAAFRAWLARPGQRILDLVGVVEDSIVAGAFAGGRAAVIDVAPWDVLPGSAEKYLAMRSRNLRNQLRRSDRNMQSLGAVHRRVGPADVARVLSGFELLHRQRGDRGALLAELPRLSAAVTAGVPRGEVLLGVIELQGRVVAVSIAFAVAGRVYGYQTARSLEPELRDVGSALLWGFIGRACDEGFRELDLLRGAEPYKIRFAGRTRTINRVQVAHGVAGRAALALMRAVAGARALTGRTLRRLRDKGSPDSAESR